jgi:hypothetical protein
MWQRWDWPATDLAHWGEQLVGELAETGALRLQGSDVHDA